MRQLMAILFGFVVVTALAGCGNGLNKAPRCKGSYDPVNSPEHYVRKSQP